MRLAFTIALHDLRVMLREKETLLWLFVMPSVFFWFLGTVQGNRNGFKGYGLTILGTKGATTAGDKHAYKGLTQEVMKFFQTGISPVPAETTLEIMAFMEAADESKRRGGAPVTLAEVLKKAGAK